MKFGDKLIQLRKKNGLSQEELAAKLNVSRQSVSKWESNNTYPETDKIVQICNIFECTMDDLINEEIKDITNIERKNKTQININDYFDSLLQFVTKTVNLFCNMKFTSGLKCLFELAVIGVILLMGGLIISEILASIIRNVFSFVPYQILDIIMPVVYGIIDLSWIAIMCIIIIHVFKIRYLDFYDQIVNEESLSEKKEEKETKEEKVTKEEKELKESKKVPTEKIKLDRKPRIIIRDKEPLAFLNILAKIIRCFVKTIFIIVGLFFTFILLLGVIGLVISLALSGYSKIFIGGDITIIGILLATVLILMLIIKFILNTKINAKISIIIFFLSIIITGVGLGTTILSIQSLEFKDDLTDIMQIKTNEVKLTYKDNLIIKDAHPRSYEYIIDNTLSSQEIIVRNEFDPRFNEIFYDEAKEYGMPLYDFYLQSKSNFNAISKIIINDLKNNVYRDYGSYMYQDDIKIVANESTINKLINNFSKIYIFNKTTTDTGYKLTDISSRIVSIYSECYGEYNALTGEIETNENCKCIKEPKETNNSKIIEYSCHYVDNE